MYENQCYTDTAPIDPESMKSGSFYTNGDYLYAVIPAPHATTYGFTCHEQICRKFKLSDGTFLENFLLGEKTSLFSFVHYELY